MSKKLGEILEVDLHFHSFISHDYDDKSITTINEYIEESKKVELPDVLAISDHSVFSLDLFKRMTEEYSDKIVLPAIELNLNWLEDNGIKEVPGKKSISMHGVFIINPISLDEFTNWFSNNENLAPLVTNIDYLQNLSLVTNERIPEEKIKDLRFDFNKLTIELTNQNIDFIFIPHSNNKSDSIQEVYREILSTHGGPGTNFILKNRTNALDDLNNAKEINKLDFFIPLIWNYSSSIIYSSDNHDIKIYPSKIDKKTNEKKTNLKTAIIFDGTFEDLKFSLSDQSDRVFYGDQIEKVRNKLKRQYLKKLIINNKEIKLSPELNTIIGRRGSGKTLLMWMIMEKLLKSDIKVSDKVGQYRNITNSKLTINNDLITENSIGYMGQGDMEAINRMNDESFNDILHSFDLKLNSINSIDEINEEETKYNILKSEIVKFREDIKKVSLLPNRDTLYKSIVNNQDKLIKQKEESKIRNINKLLNSKIELLKSELSELKNIKNVVIRATEGFSRFELVNFDDFVFGENLTTNLSKMKNNNINFVKYLDISINKYINSISRLTLVTSRIVINKIEDNNNVINPYDFFDNLFNIKSIFNKMKKLESKLDSVIKKWDDLELMVVKQNKIKDTDDLYLSLNISLEDDTNENLKSLKKNLLNIKKPHENSSQSFISYIRNEKDLYLTSGTKIPDSLFIRSEKLVFNINGVITPVSNLSPGQKTKEFLSFLFNKKFTEKSIIFIDQPEDDLDNKTINEVIVQYIRKIKKTTQIFLITHNSQIAINGNSNVILIPDLDREKILNIKSGSPLSRGIYDPLTWILEGGQSSFEERMHKIYNINSVGDNSNRVNEFVRQRYNFDTKDGLNNNELEKYIKGKLHE